MNRQHQGGAHQFGKELSAHIDYHGQLSEIAVIACQRSIAHRRQRQSKLLQHTKADPGASQRLEPVESVVADGSAAGAGGGCTTTWAPASFSICWNCGESRMSVSAAARRRSTASSGR